MTGIPAYRQIYFDLKNKIYQGVYPYNSRIPTEKELSNTYNVSRITSKRAIDELAIEHWVRRYPGKGSFVTYHSVQNKALVIGVVFAFSSNHGLEDYLSGLSKGLYNSSYSIKLFYTNHPDFSFEALFTAVDQDELSGLILQAPIPQQFFSQLAYLFYKDFPIVLLNQEIAGLPFKKVISENFSGGYQATQYAIKKGHQNIHFFTNCVNQFENVVTQRYLGYIKALSEENIILPSIFLNHTINNLSKNKNLIKQKLIEWKKNGITCLLFENDVLAIDFLSVANELGWSLPKDMSFIGFDNIPLSQLVTPNLTTIQQSFFELGVQASLNLLEQLRPFKKNQLSIHDTIEVPTKLIERSSVYCQ